MKIKIISIVFIVYTIGLFVVSNKFGVQDTEPILYNIGESKKSMFFIKDGVFEAFKLWMCTLLLYLFIIARINEGRM